ncbi:chitin elicitor receptor kinase 1-like [Physcomitrium patens]|uniref:Protein kinase domain-containing protein n=1 Tax=Physcomitrium patens TaxID=3218 RepID=A0A2K1KIF5_PHYPA|nr:chitin elicitor receptor kinase 1-like [Physcomitrium patens]PNR53543.1 hypothetical protein PHYPA_007218 [Physcomitrium patens]|eukprot:XP_024375989.1 chitin elicitor receptor kinase 1-like [Physcomitrella patens]
MGRQDSLAKSRAAGSGILLRALLLHCALFDPRRCGAVCLPETGCDTACAFYIIQYTETMDSIGHKFRTSETQILAVNPSIVETNYIVTGNPLYVPFRCDCVNDQMLHKFPYQVTDDGSVVNITSNAFQNLTQPDWVASWNTLADKNTVKAGTYLDIPVNCSCGNPSVSSDYGLFLTYPVVTGTGSNLSGIASDFNTSVDLVKRFNPGIVWDNAQPTQYAFIPIPDRNGNYTPYGSGISNSGAGGAKSSNTGVVVGAVVGGAAVLFIVLALVLYYFCVYKRRKQNKNRRTLSRPLFTNSGDSHFGYTTPSSSKASSNPGSNSFAATSPKDYSTNNSVEYTHEELRNATNGFSVANEIGAGGFAVVYYGEIRGQRLAIKKMNLQATKEFMAELQVLTHVHHTNLVQLIGYCTQEFLFLIYEFVENGTLDQHLHKTKAGIAPLSWLSRVQIALDAARGLEYIHEHTKPKYIHRDIKSANILLDKHYHAKVADFGLTKLTHSKVDDNSATIPTRVIGTWGYMSPEYARFGDVSPLVDVYAFGVVLFEILSGREAIMRGASTMTGEATPSSVTWREKEPGALVNFFDPVLTSPNGKEKLPKFMDPNLRDKYPLEAAWKMAQLAGSCTQDLPEHRPTMRTAVVALMTLSSATQE